MRERSSASSFLSVLLLDGFTTWAGLPTSIEATQPALQIRLLRQPILICGKLPLKPTIIGLCTYVCAYIMICARVQLMAAITTTTNTIC